MRFIVGSESLQRWMQLHPLQAPPGHQILEGFQSRLAEPGIEGAIHHEPARVLLGDGAVVLGGVETLLVEVGEVGRLEDPDVHVAVVEHVRHQVLLGVLLELVEGPDPFGWAQVPVVVVEALDEALAVFVGLILGAAIPEVDMAVDDEVPLAVLLIHRGPPFSQTG